jgi:hypothetical protein
VSNPGTTTVFEIAVPPGWQQLDLLAKIPDPAVPSEAVEALAEASRLRGYGTLLLVRALVARESGVPPVSAGLVATLADPRTAPMSALSASDGFGNADVSAVKLPVGRGVRVKHVVSTEVLDGVLAPAFLSVQYLLDSEHGLLTMTFTTAQGQPSGEWEKLFDAMAFTAKLI